MKKIILVFLLLFSLTSCGDIDNSNETKINTIGKKDFSKQYFTQISVNDFKKELKNSEMILIDVRTPGELDKYGKIRENQKLINFNENNFSEKINKLDRTKKYLVYCWHGNRSATVREFMKENGFSYVKDLKGGIDAWVRNGEKIVLNTNQ